MYIRVVYLSAVSVLTEVQVQLVLHSMYIISIKFKVEKIVQH